MLKPTLKRQHNQSQSTAYNTLGRSPGRSEGQSRPALSKQRTLVPEAFFQQCKNIFSKKHVTNLVGTLNTCEYNYPKAVENQITSDDPGHMLVHQDIFCFYKQKNIYFWQYQRNNFTNVPKLVKSTCSDLITAVAYRTVTYREFEGKNIKLVAIAQGSVVRFYRLRNFERQNSNCNPFLEDLLITLYALTIVTELRIIYEDNPEQSMEHNKLSIIHGDDNGNLMLFDFSTKKKHFVETFVEKIARKITQQNYSEIMQILPYKQFVFCLVKRYYEQGLWKQLQRFFRSPKANIMEQQLIEVYKIETLLPNIDNSEKDSLNIFRSGQIKTLKMYSKYTNNQIIEKMQGSYNNYFEEQKSLKQDDLGKIDHISLKKNYVEIMFKSGESILVDQEMSFSGPPKSRVKKPQTLGIIGQYIPNQSYLYEKSGLIKSLGSQLMLFEGFIASYTQQCLYVTPYSYKEDTKRIRSIVQCKNSVKKTYSNGQFVVFGLKYFTFIQQISSSLALFLFCVAMSEQYHNKKYVRSMQRFTQKISKMIEYYGEAEMIIKIIEFLMKVKQDDSFKLNIRMDLLEISLREVSLPLPTTYEEALRCYQSNQSKNLKNGIYNFTKEIEEMIWRIIFQFEKTKVEVNHSNQWKLKSIEAICVGFQVAISQTFKQIRDWNARKFSNRRGDVLRIISEARVLSSIIESYVRRQSQFYIKKAPGSPYYINSNIQTNSYLKPEKQSLKIRFCILSQTTLRKLILLLHVYEHVCEMDYNGTQLPKYSDLIFHTNNINRINFAITITRILGLGNQILLGELITTIPQLKLDQIRRYNLWKETHQNRQIQPQPQPQPYQMLQQIGMMNKFEEHNRTFDVDSEIQEICGIINQVNFKEIQEYFLTGTQVKHNINFSSPYEQQKYLSQHWLKGITALLQIGLAKIIELKGQQLQTSNIIESYKKTSENYFGVLETPTLYKKLNQLKKEIQFFTDFCKGLLERVFNKYKVNMITKEMIAGLLDTVKGQLTSEIKTIIQTGLEQYKLTELLKPISRRPIFTNNPKQKTPELPSNYMAQQLTYDAARRYN